MGRKMQVAVFPGTSGTRRNKIIVRKTFLYLKPSTRTGYSLLDPSLLID